MSKASKTPSKLPRRLLIIALLALIGVWIVVQYFYFERESARYQRQLLMLANVEVLDQRFGVGAMAHDELEQELKTVLKPAISDVSECLATQDSTLAPAVFDLSLDDEGEIARASFRSQVEALSEEHQTCLRSALEELSWPREAVDIVVLVRRRTVVNVLDRVKPGLRARGEEMRYQQDLDTLPPGHP